MIIPEGCGHGVPYHQRCVKCEIVSAEEGLMNANKAVDKYTNILVELRKKDLTNE